MPRREVDAVDATDKARPGDHGPRRRAGGQDFSFYAVCNLRDEAHGSRPWRDELRGRTQMAGAIANIDIARLCSLALDFSKKKKTGPPKNRFR
jgi:hypothetical protein